MNHNHNNNNMDTMNNDEYYSNSLDLYNINVRKRKQKSCKKTCQKMLICYCCFSLFLFINYISFCMGIFYKERYMNHNHHNDDDNSGSLFS